MRSIMKKKLLSSAMAVAMGLGITGTAQAIHLAEDGVGQLLLAPYYSVENGWRTKVSIVNTRDDVAVKTKVVLRSRDTSREILDFICYMTPADVCSFELGNKNGNLALYSSDDSIKAEGNFGVELDENAVWASVQSVRDPDGTEGLTVPVPSGFTDVTTVGHIEIIPGYAVAGTIDIDRNSDGIRDDVVHVFRDMVKPRLAAIFDINRDKLANGLGGLDSTGQLDRGDDIRYDEAFNPLSLIRSADPEWIQLTGTVELYKNDVSGDRMGYRIPALAGEVGDNVPTTNPFTFNGVPYHFDGRVLENPDFDVVVKTETPIGAQFKLNATNLFPEDNIVEIETALAKARVSSSYQDEALISGDARTRVLAGFVTKYRHLGQSPCGDFVTATTYSDPFSASGNVTTFTAVYNEQEQLTCDPVTLDTWSGVGFENSSSFNTSGFGFRNHPDAPVRSGTTQAGCFEVLPLDREIHYFSLIWGDEPGFHKGWFDMRLIDSPTDVVPPVPARTCPYDGVPALVYTHKFREAGTDQSFASWFDATGAWQ